MTEKPRFTSTISLGNVIQILALVVGGVGAYYALDARAAGNERQLIEVRDALRAEREKRLGFEVRLREVETNQARADERMTNILQLLTRIDARLERIERGDFPLGR